MQLARGSEIGRFTIGERIGTGSASVVYTAHNREDGTDVALKLLARARLFNAYARATFRQEIETLTALAHPAIVPIYQFGQHREQIYLSMPYMRGGNLATRMAKGAVGLAETRAIIATLAPALDAAHAAGLVHGNLKPTNTLFDTMLQVAVSDFGASQQAGANSGMLRGRAMLQMTYASPEQIRDERLTARSDVYALTALIYHMLMSTPPFTGAAPSEIVQAHLTAPVPSIGNELDDLFARGMAKRSAERPASIAELVTLIPEQISEPVKRRWWQRRR